MGEEETAASNSTLAISAARAAWRRSEARPAPYVLRLMYDDSHVSLNTNSDQPMPDSMEASDSLSNFVRDSLFSTSRALLSMTSLLHFIVGAQRIESVLYLDGLIGLELLLTSFQ